MKTQILLAFCLYCLLSGCDTLTSENYKMSISNRSDYFFYAFVKKSSDPISAFTPSDFPPGLIEPKHGFRTSLNFYSISMDTTSFYKFNTSYDMVLVFANSTKKGDEKFQVADKYKKTFVVKKSGGLNWTITN